MLHLDQRVAAAYEELAKIVPERCDVRLVAHAAEVSVDLVLAPAVVAALEHGLHLLDTRAARNADAADRDIGGVVLRLVGASVGLVRRRGARRNRLRRFGSAQCVDMGRRDCRAQLDGLRAVRVAAAGRRSAARPAARVARTLAATDDARDDE